MNFPDDETGQVLAEMQQAGIDLSQSHDVVFFHLFEQESQAQAMLTHMKGHFPQIACNLHPDETPNVWDLDCTINMIPSYEAITSQEETLEAIATKYNGYSDGWGIEA